MPCNCTRVNNLPCCITNLIIGTAKPDTDYYVIFKRPAGGSFIFTATSDNTGLISVENAEFSIGDLYEVSISNVAADNINEREPFTIGDTAGLTCITVQFDYTDKAFDEQTITI